MDLDNLLVCCKLSKNVKLLFLIFYSVKKFSTFGCFFLCCWNINNFQTDLIFSFFISIEYWKSICSANEKVSKITITEPKNYKEKG